MEHVKRCQGYYLEEYIWCIYDVEVIVFTRHAMTDNYKIGKLEGNK